MRERWVERFGNASATVRGLNLEWPVKWWELFTEKKTKHGERVLFRSFKRGFEGDCKLKNLPKSWEPSTVRGPRCHPWLALTNVFTPSFITVTGPVQWLNFNRCEFKRRPMKNSIERSFGIRISDVRTPEAKLNGLNEENWNNEIHSEGGWFSILKRNRFLFVSYNLKND